MKILTSQKHRFGQQVNIDGILLSFNNNGLADISDVDFEKIKESLHSLNLEEAVNPDPDAGVDLTLPPASNIVPTLPIANIPAPVADKGTKAAKKDASRLVSGESSKAPDLEEMDLSALHQILADMGEFEEVGYNKWDKPTTIKFIQDNL